MGKFGMTVCERPCSPKTGRKTDGADEVNDALLPAAVVLVTLMNREEHDRPRTEVERYIVPKGAASTCSHRTRQPTLLDVQVSDVRRNQVPRDPLRVAPQTTFAKNTSEVVQMRDVIDRRILRYGAHELAPVQYSDNSSGCCSTVLVTASCSSGGQPYLRRIRFTMTYNLARMDSLSQPFFVPWIVRFELACPRTAHKDLFASGPTRRAKPRRKPRLFLVQDSGLRALGSDSAAHRETKSVRRKTVRVLELESAAPRSSGELPWTAAFGAGLTLVSHRRNDAVHKELARVYARDSLKQWVPRAKLVSLPVEHEGATIRLRVRVRERETSTTIANACYWKCDHISG